MTTITASSWDRARRAAPTEKTVVLCSDRAFLWRTVLSAWLARFAIVVLFQLTDAIGRLRLSPDSERYHAEGVRIATEMHYGFFNWPNWIDNGWFQFTGFIYWLLWPSPVLIQMINITASALTVIPLFLVMRRITPDVRVQRFYALIVAFFPSLVYWSCLMLKDPVSILALALVIYGVTELRLRFSLTPLLLTIAGLLVYLGTREYLFVVLIMLIPIAFLAFPRRRWTLRTIALPLLIGAVPLIFGYGYMASGAFERSHYFDLDYINRVRVAMGDHGGSALFGAHNVHVWGQDIGSDVVAALRTALAVFIPVNPFDISGVRQMMALPLVFVMIYLMYLCIPGGRLVWRARRYAAAVMILATGVLAVYIAGSTNAGALFRWTTQIMPYILMAGALGLYQRPRRTIARGGVWLVRAFSRRRHSGVRTLKRIETPAPHVR